MMVFYLNQAQYISHLLHKFGMHSAASCPTPMAVGNTLTKLDTDKISYHFVYRKAIGALQYVTQTRLDISYAISKLSQYLQNPPLSY